MSKISEYPKVESVAADDVLLVDGENGTKTIEAGKLAKSTDDLVMVSAASKETTIPTDEFVLYDGADRKKITFEKLFSAIKNGLNSLFASKSHTHEAGDITLSASDIGAAEAEHTHAEFVNFATTMYVNDRFSRVAPILVKVCITTPSYGYEEEKFVKCYPNGDIGDASYSINYGLLTENYSVNIKIYPPDGYAFSGMAYSSGLVLTPGFDTYNRNPVMGLFSSNGGYIEFEGVGGYGSAITGSFVLEVA